MDKATIMGAKPPKNPPNMDIVSPVIFRAKILISLRFTTAALVMARGGMKLSERLTRSLTTYAFVKKGKHVWSALEIRVQERTAELSKTLHNLEQQMAERQRVQLELLVANEHLQHLLTSSPAIIFSVLFIINDILDFSKLEAGEMPLEHLEFNLENTLDDILDLFALSADEKGLELVGLISPSIPVNYQGDPTRLRQILSNLINNAIKFTESGYVTIEVFNARSNKKFIPLTPPFLRGQGRNERTSVSCAHFYLDRGGGYDRPENQPEQIYLTFQVKDTGIGIPIEKRDKLFKAFSQVDASHTRNYGGTGLGLAICKKLVKLMGGKIGVESVVDVGSTFWFTIPLAVCQGAPDSLDINPDDDLQNMAGKHLAGKHLAGKHLAGKHLAGKHLAGKTLLVVDAHPMNRQGIRTYATHWGMQVDEATNGEAALINCAWQLNKDILTIWLC